MKQNSAMNRFMQDVMPLIEDRASVVNYTYIKTEVEHPLLPCILVDKWLSVIVVFNRGQRHVFIS